MNALTIVIIFVAVAALILGYHRGIVKEVSSLCAILIAVIACQLLGGVATDIAARMMGVEGQESSIGHYSASIVGCGTLFIIVWLGVFLLARMFRGAVRAVKLGVIDSLLGGLFCCAKWTLALSLLLNLFYLAAPGAAMWGSNPPQGIIKAALSYAPWLFGVIKDAATT